MKPKAEILDALRGFCALIVVVLHFSENYPSAVGGSWLLPHGCLPVEYFFILTGFALTYAYDDRWGKMTLLGFFKRRILRLQPLVVVGSVIGAAIYLLASEQYAWQVPGGKIGLGQLFLLTLWCCTMLPAPHSMGWVLLHPLQGPLWTMFYIYLANVLYAVVLRHLKTWMLGVLALAAIGFTFFVGIKCGGFHAGPVWRWLAKDGSILWGGNCGALARMCFPLLVGMVIARKGWKIRTGKAGLWICMAILAAIFFAPEFKPNRLANGLFESAAVVIGMPLVLLCGIGGRIENVRLASICRFLGAYSFPLYATHYPLTVLERVWRDAHATTPWQLHLAVCCALALFAFINAWAAMKAVEWFNARLLRLGVRN